MLQFDHNLKEVREELSYLEGDLFSLFGRLNLEYRESVPRLKAYLKQVLEKQLEELQFIHSHSSDKWRKQKEKMLAGTAKMQEFQRLEGQGPQPIKYAQNWKATGTMEAVLLHRLDQMKPEVSLGADLLMMRFVMPLDGFVDADGNDEYAGIPYPLAVDLKIQDRTSGEQGILVLSDQQQKEIFEFLVNDLDEFIKRFFPKGGGPVGGSPLEIG
jgi:hypothetical protein